MTDLVLLMSKLVDPSGNILIPGVDDMVNIADAEERYHITIQCTLPRILITTKTREIYNRLDYSIADIEESVGAPIALSDDKVQVLMGRMRLPSLSLHGIEGAFYSTGAKTVIPAKVTGKFSLRLVPPQTPESVNPLVTSYLEEEFKKLKSKNILKLEYLHGGRPWMADFKHWNFEAAKAATVVRVDSIYLRISG